MAEPLDDDPREWPPSDSRFSARGLEPANWLPYDPRFTEMARTALWENRPALLGAVVSGRSLDRRERKFNEIMQSFLLIGWFYVGLLSLALNNSFLIPAIVAWQTFCAATYAAWVLRTWLAQRRTRDTAIRSGTREQIALRYLNSFPADEMRQDPTWMSMYTIFRNADADTYRLSPQSVVNSVARSALKGFQNRKQWAE